MSEDYAAGGIQRSAMALHDCLISRGHEVTIYCTRLMAGGFAESNFFVKQVSPVRSNRLLTWANYLVAMRGLLRREKPIAAISLGLFPSIALPLAGAGLRGIALFGSERAYPPDVPVGRMFTLLRKLLFPRLHRIVCQTKDIAIWFERALRIPRERLIVIPNVVRSAPPDWKPSRFAGGDRSVKTFVAVGRFDPQKGFDLALPIFERVAQRDANVRLVIVGEGPLQQELLATRSALDLDDRVEFRAPISDLGPLWSEAYALLFTSRYEGFPNVLAEAMAHGVPAVAFDCPTGPSEIVDEGRNGFLVRLGDVDTAVDRCVKLAEQPELRDRMGLEAMDVALRYSFDRVATRWEDLLARWTKPCAA